MSWLADNKEWVFSGAGVAFIGAVLTLILTLTKRRTPEPVVVAPPIQQNAPSAPVQEPVAKPTAILQMTVQQILDDIHSRPPFQRDEVAKHYIGTKVRYSGILSSLWRKDEHLVHVALEPKEGYYPRVKFIVSVNDYPEFKVMPEKTSLTVEGRIRDLEFGEAQLEVTSVSSGTA